MFVSHTKLNIQENINPFSINSTINFPHLYPLFSNNTGIYLEHTLIEIFSLIINNSCVYNVYRGECCFFFFVPGNFLLLRWVFLFFLCIVCGGFVRVYVDLEVVITVQQVEVYVMFRNILYHVNDIGRFRLLYFICVFSKNRWVGSIILRHLECLCITYFSRYSWCYLPLPPSI